MKWRWGEGYGEGVVEAVHTNDVERSIKGAEVTRRASDDRPAYVIKQDDGDVVLKSHTEVEAA